MRRTLVLALLVPLTVLEAVIVWSFDAPDTGVTWFACTESELFAVTGPSHTVYRLDTETGAVLSSWNVTLTNPAGLAFAAGRLVVTNGAWIAHTYSTSGALLNASTVCIPG